MVSHIPLPWLGGTALPCTGQAHNLGFSLSVSDAGEEGPSVVETSLSQGLLGHSGLLIRS